MLTKIPKVVLAVDVTDQHSKGCKKMTSYKDVLFLLKDLQEYAAKNPFSDAEKLISNARWAMKRDFGRKFPQDKKQTKSPQKQLNQ